MGMRGLGLIFSGAAIMLAGVALQLAMVIGLLEPRLLPALSGYAALIAGMPVVVIGALRRAHLQ